MKNDFQQVLEELQDHLLNRIKEEKDELIDLINTTSKVLDDKLIRVEDQMNRDVGILKDSIESNRVLISEKLELLMTQMKIN